MSRKTMDNMNFWVGNLIEIDMQLHSKKYMLRERIIGLIIHHVSWYPYKSMHSNSTRNQIDLHKSLLIIKRQIHKSAI